MDAIDIRTIIRDYLTRVADYPDLPDDQDIFDSGVVSSIFAIELIDFIEQRFALTVEDEDLDMANFATLDALTAFVSQKSKAASP